MPSANGSEATEHRCRRSAAVSLAIVDALLTVVNPSVSFYTVTVLDRSTKDGVLRSRLQALEVASSARLGTWLRDVCGEIIGGRHRVRRLHRDRGGVNWLIETVV